MLEVVVGTNSGADNAARGAHTILPLYAGTIIRRSKGRILRDGSGTLAPSPAPEPFRSQWPLQSMLLPSLLTLAEITATAPSTATTTATADTNEPHADSPSPSLGSVRASLLPFCYPTSSDDAMRRKAKEVRAREIPFVFRTRWTIPATCGWRGCAAGRAR